MDRRHSIESAILKISYPSEEVALSEHGDFEVFVKTRLFPIVEAAFDEISDDDTVIQFDTLELDLGDISLSYFYEDFQNRLREKLRECLENEIAFLNVYPLERHKRISRQQSELELIRNFMLTGRVSWNANISRRHDMEELFLEVLSRNGEELVEFIRKSAGRNEIIARLAAQFPPATLGRLLSLVCDVPDLESLVGDLLAMSRRSFGLSGKEVELHVWTELIRYAFNNRGTRPGREAAVLRVTKTLAALLPQHHSLVLMQLLRHTRSSAGAAGLRELLSSAIDHARSAGLLDDKTNSELRAWEELDETDINEEPQVNPHFAVYRARLVEAMKTGSIRKLKSIWLDLLGHYPELLKKVTLDHGQAAHVRRVIAHKFEEPMIRDIVKVLEPVHYGFIEQIVAEPKLYRRADEDLKMEESEAKRSLWEFTLTYLIVERGSQFNKKSYVASIMWQMAAHQNVSIEELFDSIITLLEPAAENNVLRTALLDLLYELKAELAEGLAGSAARQSAAGKAGDAAGPAEGTFVEESTPDPADKPVRTSGGPHQPDHAAVEALLSALRSARPDKLKPFWGMLVDKYGQWLVTMLRREGQHADVRRNIAGAFPDTMLREAVILLEPGEGAFIFEAIRSASAIHTTAIPKTHATETGKSPRPRSSRAAVWEFTLTYLLVDRGSRFNKKVFLASVIRQMAAHANLSVKIVYKSIVEELRKSKSTNALQRELLGILIEIGDYLESGEITDDSLSGPRLRSAGPSGGMDSAGGGKPAPPARREGAYELEQLELIRGYLLYEKLVGAISMGRSDREKISYHVVRLIHELIEHYPWKLHRFNQEVKSGNLSLTNVIGQLPKSLQRKLLLSFFSSFAGKYPFGLTAFAGRLDMLDKGLAGAGVNYTTVFSRLIDSRVTGLDALFAGEGSGGDQLPGPSQPQDAGPWSSEANVPGGGESSPPSTTGPDRRGMVEKGMVEENGLYGEPAAAPSMSSVEREVVLLARELLEHHPRELHRFNQEVGGTNLSLANAVGQLPESLQRKLLLSLVTRLAGKYPFTLTGFADYLDMLDKGLVGAGISYTTVFSRLIGHRVSGLDALFDGEGSGGELPAGTSGSSDAGQRSSGENFPAQADVPQSPLQSPQLSGDGPDGRTTAGYEELYRQSAAPLSMNESTAGLIQAYLLGNLNIQDQDKYPIVSTLELMLSSNPKALLKLLNETLTDKSASDRLVAILPESLLVKFIFLMRPADHFRAVLYADMITMACVEISKVKGANSALLHMSKWQFIFDYLFIQRRSFTEINFVRMLTDYLLPRSGIESKPVFNQRIADTITSTATSATHVSAVRIAMILGSMNSSTGTAGTLVDGGAGGYGSQEPTTEADGTGAEAEEEDDGILENIYIHNAGLVLLAPYLPQYFTSLGLFEDRKFKDRKSAERGVHLLQYLLDGSTGSFEYELVLNKILCGVKAGKPIIRGIDITDNEKTVSESLLAGVIANWPVLKNTSIEGLQESFLQREAQLQLRDDSWRLLVQSKAFDMLLDHIPWSFSTVKLAWMDKPIYVDWR